MSDHRVEGGSRSFLGLSLVILGGLLFAAGVMVGRQMALSDQEPEPDHLNHIDKRDKADPVDGGELAYHEILDKPKPDTGKTAPVRPKTASIPAETPDAGTGPKEEILPQPSGKADSSSSKKPYSLQVASYQELDQANQLAEKLGKMGFEHVRLVKTDIPGKGVYFRVRLGHFATREAAEQIKNKLAVDQAMDALVVVGE